MCTVNTLQLKQRDCQLTTADSTCTTEDAMVSQDIELHGMSRYQTSLA